MSLRALRLVVLAIPVGLAEGLELASAPLVLAAVMPRDALVVDSDREVWAMNVGWRPSGVTQLARA